MYMNINSQLHYNSDGVGFSLSNSALLPGYIQVSKLNMVYDCITASYIGTLLPIPINLFLVQIFKFLFSLPTVEPDIQLTILITW